MKHSGLARNTITFAKRGISEHGPSRANFARSCEVARQRYRERGGDDDITILTPNCIGGEIYHILGLRFNSPFINASMHRRDFISMCLDLERYLEVQPSISGKDVNGSPILTLEDADMGRVDLRFVHDTDPDVVLANWERRKRRIVPNRTFIIMDNKDVDGSPLPDETLDLLGAFDCRRKVIFVANPTNHPDALKVRRRQLARYNYRRLDGLFGFQTFFDYVSFLTA